MEGTYFEKIYTDFYLLFCRQLSALLRAWLAWGYKRHAPIGEPFNPQSVLATICKGADLRQQTETNEQMFNA